MGKYNIKLNKLYIKYYLVFFILLFSSSLVYADEEFLLNARVTYRDDGGVSVTYFLKSACQEKETEKECVNRIYSNDQLLQGFPYDDVPRDQLPKDRKDRNKWRGAKGRGIWIDHSLVTKGEKIEELKIELDKELEKSNPSTVKVVKLRRLIERVRDLDTSNNIISAEKLAEVEFDEQSLIASVVQAVGSALNNIFEGLLTSIQNGFLKLKELVTNTLKVGSPEQPAGITVYDQSTGEAHCLVVDNGQVKSIPGECTIITLPTSQEQPAEENNNETAEDTEAPVITLNGPANIEIEKGTSWSDPGATVTDNVNDNLGIYYQVDGEPTPNEGRTPPQIDTNVAGTHTIIYTSTDQAGNTGEATRELAVKGAEEPAPEPEPTPEEETPEPEPTPEEETPEPEPTPEEETPTEEPSAEE